MHWLEDPVPVPEAITPNPRTAQPPGGSDALGARDDVSSSERVISRYTVLSVVQRPDALPRLPGKAHSNTLFLPTVIGGNACVCLSFL